MKLTNVKVAIFDLCGVLIDVRWQNLDVIMKKNNVKVDKDTFKRISNEVFTLQKFKTSREAVDVFLQKLNDTDNDKLRKYQIKFLENWGKLATPNRYGMALFSFAKSCGLKTAILSNVFPVKESWRQKWGLGSVDKCFFSYENGIAKPEKKAFIDVAKFFSVKPSECLLIGDSMNKDINPAKAIGMKTLYWKEFCQLFK